MKLSKNFHIREFLRNDHNFLVTPNDYDIKYMKRLCKEILQPLRDEFNCPMQITSGLRSIGLNYMVGGKDNSAHLTGRAADFSVSEPFTLVKMFEYTLRFLDFDCLIYYNMDLVKRRFIHVNVARNKKPSRKIVLINEYGVFYSLDYWLKSAWGVNGRKNGRN